MTTAFDPDTGAGRQAHDPGDRPRPPAASAGSGRYAPRPGAAPLPRMIAAQAALETRLLLRNGEQLLLTVVIPVLLLAVLSTVDLVDGAASGPGDRVDFLTPGTLALAVFATAFTGQAIATGYERRYGVLKRLAASPLPRWALLCGKTGAVLVTIALQTALLVAVALGLGWQPHGNPLVVAALLVVGTAACSALGLLMAGTLRAEATLAWANLVLVLLLLGGGVIVPLSDFPAPVRHGLSALPLPALCDGLREVLQHGSGMPWGDAGVLAAWAALGLAAAARFFRWE